MQLNSPKVMPPTSFHLENYMYSVGTITQMDRASFQLQWWYFFQIVISFADEQELTKAIAE